MDVTAANFEQAVLGSCVPVVVDFWAPWCGPCRTLGPLLEGLAAEANGAWTLAKVDIDQEQQLAAAFRVSSIPHVIAFAEGRPIDQFVGLKSEQELRAWLQQLGPDEADERLAEAAALESQSPAAAAIRYGLALDLRPGFPEATMGLARCAMRTGDYEEAATALADLEKRGPLPPDAAKLKAEIALHASGGGVDLAEARSASEAAPDDPNAQIALADALAASGEYESALQTALAVVERFPGEAREAGKAVMLRIFEALGADPLVGEYRRQLASALY
ncbi:hypothetical protein LzC2_06480 [Planctomycetes bacterium LzC2]|uniref:Thioredoxin n=2 Tax=Alienimonas chondri TaxID=2681879 RepID=A0ABX1VAR3_9PLAN|nr:hypothetical protein [Alienimonas chondri]